MKLRALWRLLSGRAFAEDLKRNREAADRLDAAVKEMFRE